MYRCMCVCIYIYIYMYICIYIYIYINIKKARARGVYEARGAAQASPMKVPPNNISVVSGLMLGGNMYVFHLGRLSKGQPSVS